MPKRMASKKALCFVDVETTGGSAQFHRVIEIAIVTVRDNKIVDSWTSLVNPERTIPPMIQDFTGITQEMADDAPTFASIAREVIDRLQGNIFVAHNARFDYSFLKSELRRSEIKYQAKTLCTVQLSRLLYPRFKSHSLDSIIERHGLGCENRHRALDDTKATVDFWLLAQQEIEKKTFQWAVDKLLQKPALPPTLQEKMLDDLPESPGVYIFYGKAKRPIYIGKSVNLRHRVLSHFAGDHAQHKDYKITKDIVDLEVIETAGELGALLLESKLIKTHLPIFNRQLRRVTSQCVVHLKEGKDGYLEIETKRTDSLTYEDILDSYGVFGSERSAKRAIADIAEEHGLCLGRLGLEKVEKGKSCFLHQLGRCDGACLKKGTQKSFNKKLLKILKDRKHKQWPFKGVIGLKEQNEENGKEEIHIFDRWMHVTTCRSPEDLYDLQTSNIEHTFNMDTYKIVRSFLKNNRSNVVEIQSFA